MEIAAAVCSSSDADVVECEVGARALTTQDIVSLRLARHCTVDILHGNVADGDPVGGLSRWPTVQVVLLDINAVRGDILDLNVAVGYA